MIKFTAAFLAIVLSVAATLAQEPAADVDVDVVVEPFVGLTVGDPVTVTVTIAHDAGASVSMDGSLVEMGGMEPSAPVITEAGERETIVVFRTRAFRTGSFDVALPPIPIRGSDGTLTEVALNPVLITVGSVLTDDPQPRQNTGPDLLEGERRTFTPWIIAIIGIGLGFVAARFARRWRRAPAGVETAQPEAGGPDRRITFEMDESLDAAEQCRQLATSVRARLSRDWSLPATALTAAEIGPALAAAGAPGVIVLRVTRLLEACDRVQFGGEQPTPERLRGFRQLAEAIWEDGASS